MTRFVGLDLSQKLTATCIVDETGRRLWRGKCATDPGQIERMVRGHAGGDARIGVETGPMTPWLVHGHRQLVWPKLHKGKIETACPWLRRGGDAGDFGPNQQGLEAGGSILDGWNVVAAELEEVVDPVVGGEETLRLARRLEPLHLPLLRLCCMDPHGGAGPWSGVGGSTVTSDIHLAV